MATFTVPAGYRYYAASGATYDPGTTINITPAVGDSLMYISNGIGPSYSYEAATTHYPMTYADENEKNTYRCTISAGWSAFISNTSPTTVNLYNSIAGANIVRLHINYDAPTTTINNIPNKIEYIIANSCTALQQINGTMPDTLKYFYCRDATKLRSVPSFSQCIQWLHGKYCFYGCSSLVTAPTLPNSLQLTNYMFGECTSLTTGTAIPSGALQASSMYVNCSKLTAAPANNSTIITNLSYCFKNCVAITTAQNFNIRGTNNLNAYHIFYGCTALQTGPIITNADDLTQGFYNCTSLTSISSMGTVTNLYQTFYNCTSLINMPALPATITSLYGTFYNCSSLTSTPDLSNVNLVTALTQTFANCTSLVTITSFPQQPGTSILNCARTFEGCTSLTVLPQLPNYIGSMNYMFSGCINLQSQNIYIPHSVTGLNNCFASVPNLAGIITIDRNISAISNTFDSAVGPIVITGNNTFNSTDLLVMGPNVYKELEIEPDTITTVRCSDTNGTLDDNGEYIKLTAHFISIVLPNTKVYVPKVYIKTDQQEPVVDWKLTNNTTQTTTTITNSTDISVTRIEAGNLITDGTFESYFPVGEDEVVNYKIYIATSAPNVYEWDELESTVQTITKYWNGLPGSSIFTSSTFIFDATPDGNSFKIGGPIQDNEEEGFIVGNRGLPLLADQYPSTFNGPVTINSLVNIKQFADLEDNNSLYALSISQNNLNNYTNTLTADWDGNLSANGDITANGDIIDSTGRAMSEIPNIHISTSAPTSSDGEDGDIWITYTA